MPRTDPAVVGVPAEARARPLRSHRRSRPRALSPPRGHPPPPHHAARDRDPRFARRRFAALGPPRYSLASPDGNLHAAHAVGAATDGSIPDRLRRRAERRAARGGDDARRAGAGHRRRRQRQDADAGLPRRAPGRVAASRRGAILLLTFTRKAAEEMLRRASAARSAAAATQVAGGTFHSFANTVLRRTAPQIGLAPGFTILDRGDSEDVDRPGARRARARPQGAALPAQADASPRSSAWRSTAAPPCADLVDDELPAPRRGPATTSCALGARYTEFKREQAAGRLRRPAGAAARPRCATHPELARAARAAVPLRHGRRVPGHQRAAGRDRPPARGAARERHGGRRRRAEHLRLPRRRLPQHHGLPAALSRHARDHARGELPLDAADPRPRQRDHRPRAGEVHQEPVRARERGAARRCWCRRSDEPEQSRFVAPAHPRAARGGRAAGRDRGALPLELPLLRPRARAAARATFRS